jgi:hypothetical protein
MDLEILKYPIGKFDKSIEHTFDERNDAIKVLKELPGILRALTADLDDATLEKPYRPEGWTIRQVVHHIADSHANLYIRLKCALTEENPTIKGYDEAEWALMSDSSMPIAASLDFISGVHARIVHIFEKMTALDYDKSYYHNGYKATYYLRNVIQLYKWHSLHHVEHIKIAMKS